MMIATDSCLKSNGQMGNSYALNVATQPIIKDDLHTHADATAVSMMRA